MKCASHDLAAAEDGLCVLCRRAAGSTSHEAAAPAAADGRRWIAVGAAIAIALSAGVVYRIAAAFTSSLPVAVATPVAASAGGVHVTIYTTSHCPYCKQAKALLHKRGVAFEEKDVEDNAQNAAKARALTGRGGVPVLDIGGEIVAGYNEQAIGATLDRVMRRASGG